MNLIYKKHLITTSLIWTGCFVLFLFAYMLLLTPQNKGKKQIENQLNEKKQIYHSALEASQQETQVKLNKQIEQLKDGLKDYVADFENAANLTFDISQIAGDKEVGSFSIKTKENRQGPAISDSSYIFENQINISFTAGFNQFATLLNALERHRPVVFVDKFTIIRSNQGDSDHDVDMGLAVFVRKQTDS